MQVLGREDSRGTAGRKMAGGGYKEAGAARGWWLGQRFCKKKLLLIWFKNGVK